MNRLQGKGWRKQIFFSLRWTNFNYWGYAIKKIGRLSKVSGCDGVCEQCRETKRCWTCRGSLEAFRKGVELDYTVPNPDRLLGLMSPPPHASESWRTTAIDLVEWRSSTSEKSTTANDNEEGGHRDKGDSCRIGSTKHHSNRSWHDMKLTLRPPSHIRRVQKFTNDKRYQDGNGRLRHRTKVRLDESLPRREARQTSGGERKIDVTHNFSEYYNI